MSHSRRIRSHQSLPPAPKKSTSFDFATGTDYTETSDLSRGTTHCGEVRHVHSSSVPIPVSDLWDRRPGRRRQRQIVYFATRCGIPSSGKNNIQLHPLARGPGRRSPKKGSTRARARAHGPNDVWDPDTPAAAESHRPASERRSHAKSEQERADSDVDLCNESKVAFNCRETCLSNTIYNTARVRALIEVRSEEEAQQSQCCM